MRVQSCEYSNGVFFNEDGFEHAIIEHLQEQQGYEYLYGPDVARTSDRFDDAFLPDIIESSIEHINPGKSNRAVAEAIKKISCIEGSNLVAKNKSFMDMLQCGVEVSYFDGKENRNELIKLVDFDNPHNNTFHVVNQWTYVERGTNKRPDIIVFVNGLPLIYFFLFE